MKNPHTKIRLWEPVQCRFHDGLRVAPVEIGAAMLRGVRIL